MHDSTSRKVVKPDVSPLAKRVDYFLRRPRDPANREIAALLKKRLLESEQSKTAVTVQVE